MTSVGEKEIHTSALSIVKISFSLLDLERRGETNTKSPINQGNAVFN